MLCKHNECNGNVCNRDGSNKGSVYFLHALNCFKEAELGNCKDLHIFECREVNNLKSNVIGCHTDNGEYGGNCVTNGYTQNEGDQLCHLLAVNREEEDSKQSNEATDQCNVGAAIRNKGCCRIANVDHCSIFQSSNDGRFHVTNLTDCQVIDCIHRERKTDQSNGGAYNYGRHKLVDPCHACKLNNDCDNNVNEACKNCTEDNSRVACGSRSRSAECCKHRSDKREGRTQENGAAEFGEELINEGANACAEQCGGGGHAVSYDHRNRDGCGQNSQHLLECEDEQFGKLRPIFDAIDKFGSHDLSSKSLFGQIIRP